MERLKDNDVTNIIKQINERSAVYPEMLSVLLEYIKEGGAK